MIHARINIATVPAEVTDLDLTAEEIDAIEDSYNAAVLDEILAAARRIQISHGIDVVRLEVAHPGEAWEISGDALEVDLSSTPPSFRTLKPYIGEAS